MRTIASVFAFSALLIGYASAGQLSLSGQHLDWNPAASPSPLNIIAVENTEGTTDPLFAWSIGARIVRDASATGELWFADATLPTDYLLAGRSGGLTPPFAGPTEAILPIGDTDSDPSFSGVVVPPGASNLLATAFVASPDASGTFWILVIPDSFTGCNWFSGDFVARDFANVPFGSDGVVIGSITVVPEPSAAVLGFIAAAMLAAVRVVSGLNARK